MNRCQSKNNVRKPSHFSINILSEDSDNSNQNQKSRPLHQSYTVSELLVQSRIDTIPNSSPSESPRMKLRDYLFLARTASRKAAAEKRKMIGEAREQTDMAAKAELKTNSSKIILRRQKYGLPDRQMFQTLKREMEMELEEGIKQMQEIKQKISCQINQTQPSGEQMTAMYDMRILLRDKIRASLTSMESLINNSTQNQKSSIQNQPEIETGTDTPFANSLLNKNIELFEMQLQHRFSFGRN